MTDRLIEAGKRLADIRGKLTAREIHLAWAIRETADNAVRAYADYVRALELGAAEREQQEAGR